MPESIDDIMMRINAEDDASDEIERVKDSLTELDRLEERMDRRATRRETARRRNLEANARAREANAKAAGEASRAESAREKRLQAEIEATHRADDNRTRRLITNSDNRRKKVESESKAVSSAERTKQAAYRYSSKVVDYYNKQLQKQITVAKNAKDRVVAAERTKQAEHRKTLAILQHKHRVDLENMRQRERQRDRIFRRQERVARESFAKERNQYGGYVGAFSRTGGGFGNAAAFGAGVGAGVFSQLQNFAAQFALFSTGIYGLTRVFSSIIEGRARVQRLETGIRDLTDEYRAQDILPRLQEIALLPGLNYITAAAGFSRAIAGGFTDQQALRLIDQIRNAVALSQGSIEDTNEVLRQFIQIQARGKFDQENLRPILERAPFIRKVIQDEFGTQTGGEIQAIIEQRGITTTEGILRIVERLAKGPIADPTTLQNALDNVENELILLRNELGRRMEPALRSFVDGLTNLFRYLQTPSGQVLSNAALFGGIGGVGGLVLDFFRNRGRTGPPGSFESRGGFFRRGAYNELFGKGTHGFTDGELLSYERIPKQQKFTTGGRKTRTMADLDYFTKHGKAPPGLSRGVILDPIDDYLAYEYDILGFGRREQGVGAERGVRVEDRTDYIERSRQKRRRSFENLLKRMESDADFANKRIAELTTKLERSYNSARKLSKSRKHLREILPATRSGFGIGADDLFLADMLLLNRAGGTLSAARIGQALAGRPGERVPFGRGIGRAARFLSFGRTPRFATRLLNYAPASFGIPSLMAMIATAFGGYTLGTTSLEAVGKGGGNAFQRFIARAAGGGEGLLRSPINVAETFTFLSKAQKESIEIAQKVAEQRAEEARALEKSAIANNDQAEAARQSAIATREAAFAVKDFSFSMKGLLEGGLRDYRVILSESASASVQITQDFNKLRSQIGTGEGRALRTQEERDLARQGFGKIIAEYDRVEGVIRQANTEIELVERQIRAKERAIIDLGPIPEGTTRGAGFAGGRFEGQRIYTKEEKEVVELYKEYNAEIEKLTKRFQELRQQQQQQRNIIKRLAEDYGKFGKAFVDSLTNLESYIGKLEDPRFVKFREFLTDERLDRINFDIKARAAATGKPIPEDVTREQIYKNLSDATKYLWETSKEFRMAVRGYTNRPITTGLGDLQLESGTRRPSINRRIAGIIPRTGRPLPGGGEFGAAPIDVGSGARGIFSTPGGITGPLISGEAARRAAFGAVTGYHAAQAGIQAGGVFDPRNPTTIRGTGPGPNIDPVTLYRFQELNDEWQRLLETIKEFDKTRGILDTLNVAPFRGGRVREIAELIIQIGKLKQQFIDLRDARIKAIEASGADDKLKRQLIGLINAPIEELTRKIRELSKEITQLTAQGLAVQTFKDHLNSLIASVLGRRGAHTGVRALGRQLGEFFGRYTVPRGREIIRQRREDLQQEREQIRAQQDDEIRERAREYRALQQERAKVFENYFAGTAEGLYDQFIAPSILDLVGIQSGQSAARKRAFERLAEDIQQQKEAVRENDRLNARQQAEQMLEIDREYQREKRELERSYEEQRSDAWKNWVRQQLTDFPKLIVQQLNLQLAARSTNFILNSLGIGGNIPITGPGINPLALGQGLTQYAQQIGPGLRGSPGGPGTRGGNWFTNVLSRFIGGNPASGGSGAGGGGLPGSGFIPLAGRAGGVQYTQPIGPGAPGGPPLFTNGGANAAAFGSNAANAGVAVSAILAAHNIVTGTVPQFNPHRQSLFDDFGGDLLASTGTKSFFENLIFHNARNDAMARSAGMQAKMKRQAATLGRESAADIVSNFKEGFEETTTNNNEKVYIVPASTTFSMPIIIGDQETRQISYNMDQLISEGRL